MQSPRRLCRQELETERGWDGVAPTAWSPYQRPPGQSGSRGGAPCDAREMSL